MKKKSTLFVLLLMVVRVFATPPVDGEGMWLPILLSQLNETEMKKMGMKMSAEDIYSVNKGSLKDAIVLFGGGCTAEMISDKGLLLTNHHCGYDAIQQHSSLEHNYLDNGFWAKDGAQELQNKGLTATFIISMADISSAVLSNVTAEMSEKERQSQIDKNLADVRKNTTLMAGQDVLIRPMFEGNQYFLFITETYKDVRLVGAPPSSIGKFGSDTDNWVWPRHTGDFSIFRIYADKNNRPAEYSVDNVPYKPKKFLPISLDGVEQGDFTMVFGFPGRTQEYLPAAAVAQTVETLNPTRIRLRDKALKIMDIDMRSDAKTKIRYASKYARIANAWKKWIGENQGLKQTNGVGKKQVLEADFQKRVDANPTWKKSYGTILSDFNKLYQSFEPYAQARENFNETFRNVELLSLISNLNGFVGAHEKNKNNSLDERRQKAKQYIQSFYEDYLPATDQKVFAGLVELYLQYADSSLVSSQVRKLVIDSKKDYSKLSESFFKQSFLLKKDSLLALFDLKPAEIVEKLNKDAAFSFGKSLIDQYSTLVEPKIADLQPRINGLQRQYMAALMTVFSKEKRFFPDANSTLRVTYGQAEGYQPRDGVTYQHYTYLDGVIEKYVPGDYEFDVPQKLRDLFEKRDFGNYAAKNGKMPVCFIGSNHTTGGNSGSPAIDAHGNLIGLNFDRVWEGTMSDINYDKTICRNIMVDARYILFIIDKFAGAGHLIKELKLVHPKH
jgi:Peptidase S46